MAHHLMKHLGVQDPPEWEHHSQARSAWSKPVPPGDGHPPQDQPKSQMKNHRPSAMRH